MRRSIRALMLAVVLTMVVAGSALAYHLLGGKWTGFPLNYYIGGDQVYTAEINTAASNWSSAGTRVAFNRTLWNGSENVWINPANYGNTYWGGQASLFPSNTANPYTYAYIRLNRFWLDGFQGWQRTHVAAHELGHAVGLYEEDLWFTCELMEPSGFCAAGVPQADDINGVRALYP